MFSSLFSASGGNCAICCFIFSSLALDASSLFSCSILSSSSFLFCFSLDSLPLYHDPVPPLAAHDARALQARLVGKSDIHDAARSGSMGLVQDHILADGACVHKKDM